MSNVIHLKPRTRSVRLRHKVSRTKWAELYIERKAIRLKVDARLSASAAVALCAQLLGHASELNGGDAVYDPRDSLELQRLREAIDRHLTWPSLRAQEDGDYLGAVALTRERWQSWASNRCTEGESVAEELRSPYPWQGGKSRVAEQAWAGLGPDCVNYIEPFFGSGAMLLLRPGGPGKIETVNDLDGAIPNFWRAIQHAPDEVAAWCDWPVSELDLHARHAWLVQRLEEMAEQLRADPNYYDAQVAGWWVWGICQWIGTGWCGGIKHGEPRPNLNSGQGVHAGLKQQIPALSVAGGRSGNMGVHGATALAQGTRDLPHQRPHVSGDSAGMGVIAPSEKLPNLSGYETGTRKRGAQKHQLPKINVFDNADAIGGVHAPRLSKQMPMIRVRRDDSRGSGAVSTGCGVHGPSGLPAIGNDRGINGVAAPPCLEWFRALQQRLRRVRVVCGDWTRVLGNSVLGKGKNVGGRRPCAVFLDPPYDPSLRAKRIYNHDEKGVAIAVREWALEHGDDPDLRIALCGYFAEHADHMPPSWRVLRWKGARGYAGEDNDNREQETIWFSPHCLSPVEAQRSLFEVANG